MKTLVMGIVNVTPDSFSDGGKYFSPDAAIAHAKQLIADGADILDVGAESTRPNAIPISAAEEIARLEKVLPAIKNFGVPISIDTYKPEVAEFSLERGANIINDVHGLEDSRMVDVAKKFNAKVIAGHSDRCSDGDIIEDVKKFFRHRFWQDARRRLGDYAPPRRTESFGRQRNFADDWRKSQEIYRENDWASTRPTR